MSNCEFWAAKHRLCTTWSSWQGFLINLKISYNIYQSAFHFVCHISLYRINKSQMPEIKSWDMKFICIEKSFHYLDIQFH